MWEMMDLVATLTNVSFSLLDNLFSSEQESTLKVNSQSCYNAIQLSQDLHILHQLLYSSAIETSQYSKEKSVNGKAKLVE